MKAKNIRPQQTTDYLNSFVAKNTSSSEIKKDDVVRVVGVTPTNTHLHVKPGLAGAGDTGPLYVAAHKIPAGDVGIVRKSGVLTLDTSAATAGDKVFLSDSTGGAITLVDSGEQVGWVGHVGVAGLAIVDYDAVVPVVASSTTPTAEALWDGTRILLDKDFVKDMLIDVLIDNTTPGYDPVFSATTLGTPSSVLANQATMNGPLVLRAYQTTAGHGVVARATGGSVAKGYSAGVWVGQASADDGSGWLTGNEVSFKAAIRIDNGANAWGAAGGNIAGGRFVIGLTDPAKGAETADVGTHDMYARYDSTISPNWFLVVCNGGVVTTQDTGVAVAEGTRYAFEFDVNAALLVTLKINGVLVADKASYPLGTPTDYIGVPTFSVYGVTGSTKPHSMSLYKMQISSKI